MAFRNLTGTGSLGSTMKIYSWNVNGIRAATQKGFIDWFQQSNGDIICLQEVKAFAEQLEDPLRCPKDYYVYWHNGTKKGYSGTATYSKIQAKAISYQFDQTVVLFQEDGRIIETEFEQFTLLNIYFPNGNPRAGEEDVLSKKLQFYDFFLRYMDRLKNVGKSIIACGDYNIAHTEMDIARPKENENSIGFLAIERDWISKIIASDYIDVFRHFHPEAKDNYTWWSYRTKARDRNIGWRIDYFFISPDLLNKVKNVGHQQDVFGSDHCPIFIEIDL